MKPDLPTTPKGRTRPQTLSAKRGCKPVAARYPLHVLRPETRGDCVDGPRPCPFVSCRYHLYIDVDPRSGALKLNFPHLEAEDMPESCALDVADRGGAILEDVALVMNLTRERVRQLVDMPHVHARLRLALKQWQG